jgi:hypothetical protein
MYRISYIRTYLWHKPRNKLCNFLGGFSCLDSVKEVVGDYGVLLRGRENVVQLLLQVLLVRSDRLPVPEGSFLKEVG